MTSKKLLLILAAAGILAAGCKGGLKTETYTDEEEIPTLEGRADTLSVSISLEYPVKGAEEDILGAMTRNILSAAFGLEDSPVGTVEQTVTRYVEDLKDDFFTIEASEPEFWEDRVNGYFSGEWKDYRSYMVEYYTFQGGPHGEGTMAPLVLDLNSGEVVEEADFFADGYEQPVGALIRKRLPEALDGDEQLLADIYDLESVAPNGNFEVTSAGVTWYFNPYDIAPYYMGVIRVTVPWNELTDYLR